MSLLRRLDTSQKLYASFAIVLCLSSALVLWMLGQLGAMSDLTARPDQKLSVAQASYASVRAWTCLFMVTALAVTAALAAWLRGELSRPLQEAGELARRIAAGDLSTRGGAPAAGEGGALLCTMQEMNDKLAAMIVKVRSGTEAIAGSAGEFAAQSRVLSARTEEREAALEEAAAMVAVLAAAAGRHAGHAQQAAAGVRALAGVSADGWHGGPDSLEQLGRMVESLAAAGAGQAAGIGQLAVAIAEMRQASELHAGLVERSAALATTIRDQAGNLSRTTAAFSLGKNYALPTPAIHLVSNNPHKLQRIAPERRGRVSAIRAVVSNSAQQFVAPAPAASPLRSRGSAAPRDLDWEEF